VQMTRIVGSLAAGGAGSATSVLSHRCAQPWAGLTLQPPSAAMASLAAFIPGFLKRRKRAAEEEEAHELRSSLYSASRAVLVEACVELHAAHKALAQRNAELQRMLDRLEQWDGTSSTEPLPTLPVVSNSGGSAP